jgi:hypothetical protein
MENADPSTQRDPLQDLYRSVDRESGPVNATVAWRSATTAHDSDEPDARSRLVERIELREGPVYWTRNGILIAPTDRAASYWVPYGSILSIAFLP